MRHRSALPAMWLSTLPRFNIAALFYWSVAAVALQATLCLGLLNRERGKRLSFATAQVTMPAQALPQPTET